MKSSVTNVVMALGLVAIGVAIGAASIHVGDTDDAPGAALMGLVLMIGAVALAVRTARRRFLRAPTARSNVTTRCLCYYNHGRDLPMPESTPLDVIERALADLTPGEKATLLQKVAHSLGGAVPGIDLTPDVCGGDACVARTRVPVWVLVQARRLGATEAELLEAYPSLRAEDLVNAWAYARLHPAEIDEQIRAHEAA